MTANALVWFRNDLRLHDNPALTAACKASGRVTAVFIVADEQWQVHGVGSRRLWFTQLAVNELASKLAGIKIGLRILRVPRFVNAAGELLALMQSENASALFFNREYGLDEQVRDKAVVAAVEKAGLSSQLFDGSVILPPGKVLTKNQQPYKVFTAFKREWLRVVHDYPLQPLPEPKALKESSVAKGLPQADFAGKSQPDDLPHASEDEAHKRLASFTERGLFDYDQRRDLPAVEGTSSLSPYLAMGLVSARACLHAARMFNHGELQGGQAGCDTWINELIWRDFYLHLLDAFPAMSLGRALKPETDRLTWHYDDKDFAAWCEGRTGFPLVDAAMRQLNETGWMHNRLRMVVATFLSKYLFIDWRWGEKYFMQQLVDAHFAANNGGWQWSASTGTDAVPYFRILSPVRQAERFDPDAVFIKRFLPELRQVAAKDIHKPGCKALLEAGYPAPIVNLTEAKSACISAFKAL